MSSEAMTNYNERLDDVLASHGAEEGEFTESLKQDIASLIKELVAEAKPKYQALTRDMVSRGEVKQTIDQFEQNLLKALEEV